MPRFVAKSVHVVVSTSFKVMYSSFVESNLPQIDDEDFLLYIQSRKFAHYMAVRDPYARLASFFADKLRQSVQRSEGEWQECQKIFFPFIRVAICDPYEIVRAALLRVSFDQFIDYLPYLREEHLVTQSSLLEAGGVDLKPCAHIFRIESDVRRLWDSLDVKHPPHANKTATSPDVSRLTRERLDIVNEIYSVDFANFGYEMR